MRIVWDADAEEYYLSIVDVVQVLTDSVDATAYWRKLKQRLKAEGNEIVIVTDWTEIIELIKISYYFTFDTIFDTNKKITNV